MGFDLQFHEIEQVRPTRNGDGLVFGGTVRGVGQRSCASVGKGLHAVSSATSRMAATMFA